MSKSSNSLRWAALDAWLAGIKKNTKQKRKVEESIDYSNGEVIRHTKQTQGVGLGFKKPNRK
jgi:hypothetical protein